MKRIIVLLSLFAFLVPAAYFVATSQAQAPRPAFVKSLRASKKGSSNPNGIGESITGSRLHSQGSFHPAVSHFSHSPLTPTPTTRPKPTPTYPPATPTPMPLV